MRVLVIKTSSLGDVIHTLPALTDAANVHKDIQFDWVVEESFQMIPSWHKNVKNIIPIAFRKWRKQGLAPYFNGDLYALIKKIRQESYDAVIDAQGLLKSAFLTLISKGKKIGYSWSGAREPVASLFYSKHAKVSWDEHAVQRARMLFANALQYTMPVQAPDYGIDLNKLISHVKHSHSEKKSEFSIDKFLDPNHEPYCVLLHGTTWQTKHWPDVYWIQLANKITAFGLGVKLLWGNNKEFERANKIKNNVSGNVEILPKLGLDEIAIVLAFAKGIVSVDTGLGHLTAALAKPQVSLYGPTDPKLTGMMGPNQYTMSVHKECAPCFSKTCQFTEEQAAHQTNNSSHNDSNSNRVVLDESLIFPPCYKTIPADAVWQTLKKHLHLQ